MWANQQVTTIAEVSARPDHCRCDRTTAKANSEVWCSAKTLPHGRGSDHREAMIGTEPHASARVLDVGEPTGDDDRRGVGATGPLPMRPDHRQSEQRSLVFGEDPPSPFGPAHGGIAVGARVRLLRALRASVVKALSSPTLLRTGRRCRSRSRRVPCRRTSCRSCLRVCRLSRLRVRGGARRRR